MHLIYSLLLKQKRKRERERMGDLSLLHICLFDEIFEIHLIRQSSSHINEYSISSYTDEKTMILLTIHNHGSTRIRSIFSKNKP